MQKKQGNALAARALLFLISAFLTVGAAVLFRGVFTYAELVSRVLAGIGGVLCALVGAFGWLVLIAAIATGGHRNIFLYDRKTKTTLPLEALDWPLVRERLGRYFRVYLSTRRRGYLPLPLEPLLMPYLLLVFIDSAPDSDWNKLFREENAILSEMISGLERFGLGAPAEILRNAASHDRGRPASVKTALVRHRASVESAILSHIREHIDEYDL